MNMLCGKIRDHYDTPDNTKIDTEDKLTAFINKIKDDSRKKKLEHMNSTHKDDMDVGGMDQDWDEEQDYSQEQVDDYWWQYDGMDDAGWNTYEELGGDWNQYEDDADANMTRKGKVM